VAAIVEFGVGFEYLQRGIHVELNLIFASTPPTRFDPNQDSH